MNIPHGCDGQATHTVRVELPEGFYAAKPMPKPGWELTTETGPYAAPYDNHGHEMTEGVRAITWTEGDLPDAWFDQFTFRGRVGPKLSAGDRLDFVTVQTCADGQVAWDGSDEGHPAPALTLTAAQGDGHGHHHAAADEVELGDLTIRDAFALATPPNAPVAGGFLTLVNEGAADDRLIAARSDVAGRVEIHEMAMEGDVMKMRELPDGLPIPAGETVELKPGGYHIMFMDLKGPLVEGETAAVTLVFETAGEVEVQLPIKARGAAGGHGHGQDHGMLRNGEGGKADHASAAEAGRPVMTAALLDRARDAARVN